MLNATANAKLLKRVIKMSSVFLSETRMRIDENGITIRAVDNSNVCLTDVFITKEDFEEFEAEKGIVGVNVRKLNDILKIVKSDVVRVECDENLRIRAGNTSYCIALIDPTLLRPEQKLPTLEFRAEAIISADNFKSAVSMISKVADSVILFAEDEFQMIAENNGEKAQADLSEGYVEKGVARVVISLEHLKNIARVLDNSDTVRLAIGSDLPVIGFQSNQSFSREFFT